MKLAEIAAALEARVEGDGDMEILRAVPPAEAEGAGDLALAMDRKMLPLLAETKARAVVVAEGAELPAAFAGVIRVKRPQTALAGLMDVFEKPVHVEPGIHPSAVIAPDAVLGEGVSVGPFVYVGPKAVVGAGTILMPQVTVGAEARIGENCLLHPGVRIGERVRVGDRCILHHNASIGADGFSFVTPEPGSVESAKATGEVKATNAIIRRVNSIGAVVLGDDVEVGAGTCIDRGTVSDTRIGSGTKIDNLVQIGHNVQVGANCMLCGQVGIAGSAVVGDRVVLAGKVGVGDHVKIGHDAVVGAYSAVGSDVQPRTVMLGIPAVPRQRAFDQFMHINRLKGLFADVADLKRQIKAIVSGGENR